MDMHKICSMGAPELSQSIHSRKVTCVAVMTAFLDRIGRYNGRVNAIVDLAPRETLLAQAKELDDKEVIPKGKPLWGFPFAIKDLYDAKGFITSQGHLAFANNKSSRDEDFVRLIRGAGAIIIGKTNTPEFGAGSHTFNTVYGLTRNPFDLTRTAGGSSGGAAAALASSFVPLADGSDYAGSLRNPAAMCGVVGFRKTVVDPKKSPVKSGDWENACIGPMGRTVSDVRLLCDVMFKENDTPNLEQAIILSPTERIAFLGDCGGRIPIESAVLAQLEKLIPALQAIAGPQNVERTFPAGMEDAFRAFLCLRYSDYAANFSSENLLQVKGAIRWNVEKGQALSREDVSNALAVRASLHKKIDAWMETYRFFVLPTTQCVAFRTNVGEWPEEIAGKAFSHYLEWMQVCCELTLLGLPSISIPCGIDPATQMPVGAQIVGRRGADKELLRFAYAVEKSLGPVVKLPHDIGGNGGGKTKKK